MNIHHKRPNKPKPIGKKSSNGITAFGQVMTVSHILKVAGPQKNATIADKIQNNTPREKNQEVMIFK